MPGGGSAPWFLPDQLDLPFEGKLVGAAGSMLGSGAIMVMDETTDIPYAALTLARFYAHESCGKCVPCREGGTWLERILQRVVEGHGAPEDLDLLLEVGESICPGAFPHAASERLGLERRAVPVQDDDDLLRRAVGYAPVHSALTLFRDEFEAKIKPRTRIPVTVVEAPELVPRRRSARMTDHPKPARRGADEAAEAAATSPSTRPSPTPSRAEPEPDPNAVPITINGRPVTARKGELVIAAAERARRVHPALLLAQPDELGRHVPHVPRRGRQRARPAAHAVVHGHRSPRT